MAREEGPRESFDELMDTPLDFSAFMMNRLKIDTLTPELLAGPTFELMKGTCKSLVELEYFFEEVYKATTDQLDWHNPEGQQYPHDLRKPLPLIPNSRGRQVIPFDHFINNDLAYLSGGVSSRTYATSVIKTKAADYGHIKWIEDLVPNTIWSEVPVNYDKHALWGISHWGCKHQQFYGFAANREFACDVYSKRRIITEGDFKWLRLHDIEDMLILLVQGKLTNLNVEDRLAFGVSLRMFTRSIVIQRRVKDLQLVMDPVTLSTTLPGHSRCSRSHSRQAKEQDQDLKSMITTSNHKLMIEVKDYELKTKVEALVPSCFVIFDLEPLSLSFNFFEHEHVVMNSTPAEGRHHHLHFMYPEIKQLAIKRVDSKNLLDRVSSLRSKDLYSSEVLCEYQGNRLDRISKKLLSSQSQKPLGD
ncbi:hypothetical protein Tco_0682308 [Tanacetum coccineum]|uniref:Uncharacterized protein n=1 Tax=Tanacetum coccineum TaxID=301880 RepID=A0ABQ4XSP9_9ASTR